MAATFLMKMRSAIKLFRPMNSGLVGALAGLSVAWPSGAGWSSPIPAFCFVAWTCLAAGAYAFNDIVDIRKDAINRPGGYLAAHARCPLWLRLSIGALVVLGLMSAFLAGAYEGAMAVVWASAAYGYSLGLKAWSGLAANLLTATCIAGAMSPGLFHGLAFSSAIWLMPILFLLMLGREVLKDVEDSAGDLAVGERTMPLTLGHALAGRIAAIIAAGAWTLLLSMPASGVTRTAAILLSATGVAVAVAVVIFPPNPSQAAQFSELTRCSPSSSLFSSSYRKH
jgi:4-hydroxybenzoate polyprenyltransferase